MWTGDSTHEPFEDPLHLLLDIFQAAVRVQDSVNDQVYTVIVKQCDKFQDYQSFVSRTEKQLFYKK
jgi:hypothetical protein